jgi:hypothetical protein
MGNNVFCPICGYNFGDERIAICPSCKIDLRGKLYKTYEGTFLYHGLMPFKMSPEDL